MQGVCGTRGRGSPGVHFAPDARYACPRAEPETQHQSIASIFLGLWILCPDLSNFISIESRPWQRRIAPFWGCRAHGGLLSIDEFNPRYAR